MALFTCGVYKISNKSLCPNITIESSYDIPLHQTYFEFFMELYIISLLCIIGFLGNIVSIVVLRKDRERREALFLLQMLALADAFYLIVALLRYPLKYLIVNHEVYMDMQPFIFPLLKTAQTITIWMMILVTIERYMCVSRPIRARQLFSGTRKRIFSGVIFLCGVLYNIPRYFDSCIMKFDDECVGVVISRMVYSPIFNHTLYFDVYQYILYILFLYVAPLTILLVLNTRLFITIRRTKHYKITATTEEESVNAESGNHAIDGSQLGSARSSPRVQALSGERTSVKSSPGTPKQDGKHTSVRTSPQNPNMTGEQRSDNASSKRATIDGKGNTTDANPENLAIKGEVAKMNINTSPQTPTPDGAQGHMDTSSTTPIVGDGDTGVKSTPKFSTDNRSNDLSNPRCNSIEEADVNVDSTPGCSTVAEGAIPGGSQAVEEEHLIDSSPGIPNPLVQTSTPSSGDYNHHHENNATVVLIIIVVVFIVCETPELIYKIITIIVRHAYQNDEEFSPDYWHNLAVVCELMMVINCSVNFFIYCAFGKRFRKNLKSMICCKASSPFMLEPLLLEQLHLPYN